MRKGRGISRGTTFVARKTGHFHRLGQLSLNDYPMVTEETGLSLTQ
jgi:hypothetical protein